MNQRSGVIAKTLDVIRAFTDKQTEWGVNELARFLDLPVSSLHRILKTLREQHVLQVHPRTGKYTFGPELMRISSIVYAKSDLKNIAEPFLKRLSETLNETVYLALYYRQHQKLSFIYRVQSPSALQYLFELGVLQPVHIAASGKAILSFLSDEEIQSVLDAEKVEAADRAALWDEINTIRKLGYSITSSERKKESIGIGAPLFDASNQVIGSIICAIPAHLYDIRRKDFIVQNVMEEAGNISRNLGYDRASL